MVENKCQYCGAEACWYCAWCPNMQVINNKGSVSNIVHDCKDYLELDRKDE